MLARRLGLCAVLGWALWWAPARALAGWSRPKLVAGCARASSPAPPQVVFPSSQPRVRSGPGALLWTGPGGCGDSRVAAGGAGGAGGAGAARGVGAAGGAGALGGDVQEVRAAAFGPQGLPGSALALSGGLAEVGQAAGTALGQVIVVGASEISPARDGIAAEDVVAGAATGMTAQGGGATRAPAQDGGALTEGRLPLAFGAPLALGGPASPVAVTSGYLGDAAVVSTLRERRARWALAVRVQRHYSAKPAPPRLLTVGAVRPSALAAAMDYRGDLLVVWAAGGSIYARELAAGGAVGPLERVGVDVGSGVGMGVGSAPGVGVAELRALISDDGRAIVAWRTQAAARAPARSRAPARARGGLAVTSIDVSISGPGMVFAGAAAVESFADLPGLEPPPGALRLTRLSSEAVMMAWTGMRGGRYVVRASPVSLRRGVWAPVTISPRGRQALLADLVSGPRAEALALWTTAPRVTDGQLDPRRRAVFAAWGHYGGHGEARFATPEALAAAGSNGIPGAAFDPQSDMALAAWTTGLRSPRVVYARRAAGAPEGSAVALEVERQHVATQRQTQRQTPMQNQMQNQTRAPARGASGVSRGVWLAALGLLLVAVAGAAVRRWGRGAPTRA